MPAPTPNLELDYLPRLPRRKDFRIGCVGAGFIMRDCHLVAYRQAGFNPIAVASRNPDRARAAAAQHNIPRVHATYAELLADPQVEVLDGRSAEAGENLAHVIQLKKGHVCLDRITARLSGRRPTAAGGRASPGLSTPWRPKLAGS